MGEVDLEPGASTGEWSAQFVRRVGDESILTLRRERDGSQGAANQPPRERRQQGEHGWEGDQQRLGECPHAVVHVAQRFDDVHSHHTRGEVDASTEQSECVVVDGQPHCRESVLCGWQRGERRLIGEDRAGGDHVSVGAHDLHATLVARVGTDAGVAAGEAGLCSVGVARQRVVDTVDAGGAVAT